MTSTRAHIVLSSANGESNNLIPERLMLTKATVGKWCLPPMCTSSCAARA